MSWLKLLKLLQLQLGANEEPELHGYINLIKRKHHSSVDLLENILVALHIEAYSILNYRIIQKFD